MSPRWTALTAPLVMTLGAMTLGGMTLPVSGQSLDREVREAPDGWVVFHYATHDDVEICEGGSMNWGGSWTRRSRDRGDCSTGVAQVELRVRGGEVTDIDIGPAPRNASAAAILPAMIARDVAVWPELVEMARDRRLDEDVREQAVFWLGQEVADAGGREPEAGDDDQEADVREAAVFALSQRSEDESVPRLMEVARTSHHSNVRRSAVFWLSQTDDDRVIDFFEEILRGG